MPSQLKAKGPAARKASVTTSAFFGKKKAPEPEPEPEESNFWKKVFLKEGQEEVKAADYNKWKAELNARKAANAKNAKPRFLGLF